MNTSIQKDKNNNCSYVSVEQKYVHTIKDLTIEAAKKYKNKTYIRYYNGNEMVNVSFEDMLSVCKIYTSWICNEIEKLVEGRGVHVGLIGIGNYNYFIAYLSTIYSGNVTIPLDPNLDYDTLTFCINHGDVDVIFYETKFQSKINELKEKCPKVKKYILIEKDDEHPELLNLNDILINYKGQEFNKEVKPDDNALMIYTSGTTGRKKGVVITHDNLVDKFFSTFNYKGYVTEIYLCVLPLYHIFSVNDFLFSLRFGFTVCFNFDLSKLVQSLQLYQPTKTSLVPLLAKNLLNLINMNIINHPELSVEEAKQQIVGKNFYKIQSGGGYLSPELADGYNKLGILIGQSYGLTETSSKASLTDFNPKKIASVGRVAPNSEIRISNGEIQIKSRAVMKEYYKEPEKTKEAFTEDGWLHTGDLGYFDEDGYLYLVGRSKNLIILSNGENVSPEKIESIYNSEPLVQEIIVYGYDDVICAEIYPNLKYAESMHIGKDSIKENLWKIIENKNKDLPSYENIVKLTIRDTPFEKTASKKIIRSKFMEELEKRNNNNNNNANDQESNGKKIMMPTNDIQKKLFNIVKSSVGDIKKEFGIDSDLYDIGLDSFNCTLLTSRISEEFHINMKLTDIVHNSSILKLEKFVNHSKKNDIDLSIREFYPMATNQFCMIYAFTGTMSNITVLYRLDKGIDLPLLKASLEKLINIHVELKATIRKENGKCNIYRHDNYEVNIPIKKLTDKEWESTKDHLVQPYKDDDQLYRITIYETESNHYLLFDMSHLMSDGYSFKILMKELDDIYSGRKVEPKEITYYEHLLLRQAEVGKTFMKSQKLFSDKLEGITIPSNPFTRKDAYVSKTVNGDRFKKELSKIDMNKVLEFCEKNSITENTLFTTAASHAFALYENMDEVIINNVNSGRLNEKWERSIGCFARFYPLRYTMKKDERTMETLHRTGKQIMEGISEDHTYVAYNTFYFQYQGDIIDIDSIGNKPITQEPIKADTIFLQFSIYKIKGKYILTVVYWKNIYERQQLEGYANLIEDVVASMINGTKLVKDIRAQIAEEHLTTKRTISVDKLNESVGQKLVSCEDEKNTMVNVYILNKHLERQVMSGWGDLYIEENEFVNLEEKIDNPYGEGKLCKTGFTAKFLPDGAINVLENDCRFWVTSILKTGDHRNINIVEKLLSKYEGIEKAYVDLRYKEKFQLIAHIYGKEEPDMTQLNEYLKSHLNDDVLIPKEIIFNKLE
eukprot:jgi/Orpsp1_1/1185157/evm.model.c7180000092547.1